MAEYNIEGKLSKSSILKPRKSVIEANESSSDCREPRRVSFASSNFVKPFAADAEKNTIWDNTYEEEVLLTDSTRSLDQFETEESVKFNDSAFIYKANSFEQDMELTNVLSNNPIVNKNMMQTVGEICTKDLIENSNVIATETYEEISKKVEVNHSSKKDIENHNLDASTMDVTCTNKNDISEDMEFTCAFPNGISNIDLKNKEISTTMEFTCVLPQPQPINTSADILEDDMEYTCVFTNFQKNQKELSSFYIYQSNCSSTEVNDGKTGNSEISDTMIIEKNKYQSIPHMLHAEESSNSSYAMLLNSSLYPENPGENIFSVKPSKTINNELKCNGYQPDVKTYLNISTEPEEELIQKTSPRNENGTGTTNKENSILCDNLLDTISVNLIHETSISCLQNSIEEVVGIDKSISEKNDLHGILNLLKRGREMLNLPKIEIPLHPIDALLEKLDEIESLHYQLLEKLEPPKIKLIDLEELEQLEEDFDASVSGFSAEIVTTDSSFSDIPAPKSLEELVKEAAPRSKKYWEFVKLEKDCYCFHIAEGMVSFKAKVQPEMGLVDEIRLYNNLPDNERPHVHYIAQYLEYKLKMENLLLPLGDKFDLLALLDYVCICVSDIKHFYVEFEKLVEEYGPIHKFRMDRDFNVIVEVMRIDLVIWWVITLKISPTSLGYITQISARSIYEEVDENQVKSIKNKVEGPKYLRHFILLLQDYVKVVGKQVKARREIEFLNI